MHLNWIIIWLTVCLSELFEWFATNLLLNEFECCDANCTVSLKCFWCGRYWVHTTQHCTFKFVAPIVHFTVLLLFSLFTRYIQLRLICCLSEIICIKLCVWPLENFNIWNLHPQSIRLNFSNLFSNRLYSVFVSTFFHFHFNGNMFRVDKKKEKSTTTTNS